MKKYIVTTLVAFAALVSVKAQEFKLAKSTGKIVINLSSVTVEGYSGNEIIFSSDKEANENDDRAKGLRPISGSGLTDNTGLGISVTEKDGVVEVTQVSAKNAQIKIKLPKAMSVSYSFSKVMNAGKGIFKNLESEIDVSVQYNSIQLENVTGPLAVKSVYGGVDVKFGENIKGPISVVSIYGYVDASIPVTTKANIKMSTSYGEILAASDLKIEIEKTGDMVSYSDKVKGKLNGGGFDLSLTSNYGKVYLRKN
ncbi:DUF4097 family beta strand repeat-containing protein [Sediminibacterium ginsengisoli]|uniref:DUF4097 domain-containing protein n=1 Tax=Sediminibacterium ginsengisoli TaxID=413434 RepID=A0A1T4K0V3_9BACT|nr:DUF4097 family beta strand repeat-containing protein [Sediminibacterium ginsengisoli]SJZ35905.1 hypothetical protein SAMN04488132_101359 [Sediminibacterium ginsengisoli]